MPYGENYTYDANGNIETLQRRTAESYMMDNLSYHYHRDGNSKIVSNRLYHFNDNAPLYVYVAGDLSNNGPFDATGGTMNTANNFGYDEIGNLQRDASEEIADIQWDVYGKIKGITRTNTSSKPDLLFIYTPTGERALKVEMTKSAPGTLAPVSGWGFTAYLRDASGNVMNTKSGTGPGNLRDEFGIYGSSRLGTWSPKIPAAYLFGLSAMGEEYRLAGDKAYELSNHLGNVMVTVSDRKVGYDNDADGMANYYHADIISMNDYYTFGMPMPDRAYSSNSYRYGFNGQEKDDEVKGSGNSLEFKYRIYDSRLGKFLSVDPLTGSFPWNSPYAFAENRVIDGLELEGLEVVLFNKKTDPDFWEGAQTLTDKSAIHVAGHGGQTGINDANGNKISTSAQFTTVLKTSDQYQVQQQSDNMCVVLHSCRTGRPITNSDGSISPSFAQRMSEDLGITVIAPDERDYFSSWGEKGPYYTKHTDETNRDYLPGTPTENHGESTGKRANWLVYKEGVLSAVYSGGWTPTANPSSWDNFFYKKDLSFSVNSNTLNLRTGAGTGFAKNGDALSKGAKLNPTGNVKKGWMEVNTGDGRTGWVNSKHTKAEY